MTTMTRTILPVLAALTLSACSATLTNVPVTQTAPSGTPGAAQPAADPCHQAGATYCALNPAVTQATVAQTICVRGWTATIRPPSSYTEGLKRQQIASEHLPGRLGDYEEDHRMPLELGGAPSDQTNLSPESPASPNPKDHDESSLREEVCAGRLTLDTAQQQLVGKWLAPYPGYKA
jgi:hypothetical protein